MSKINCHFKDEVKKVYIYQNLITFKKRILKDFNESIDNIDYLYLTAIDNSFSAIFKIENQIDYNSIIYDLNVNNIFCKLIKNPISNNLIENEKHQLNEKIKEAKNLISQLKKDIEFYKYKYNFVNSQYTSLKRDFDIFKIESKNTFDDIKNLLAQEENIFNSQLNDNEISKSIIILSDNDNKNDEISINDNFKILKKSENNNDIKKKNENKKNNNNNFNYDDINQENILNNSFKLINDNLSQEMNLLSIECDKKPIYKKKKEINIKNPIIITVIVKNNSKIPIPATEIICDQDPKSNLFIFNTIINNGNEILPYTKINVNLFVYFKNYENIKTGLNTISIYLKKKRDNELIGEKEKIEIIIEDDNENENSISSNSIIQNSLKENSIISE